MVYIEPNGDVREVITISAVALRERVYFIRMTAGSRWDQPERYRRNVKVVARSLTVNNSPGPRWIVTTSWTSAQKLTAILHLHGPIKQGEKIRFEVVRTWPAKCRPLMRHDVADSFIFRTGSRLLDVRRVEYKIVLPVGFEAVHEPIGLLEPDVHLTVNEERDQENRNVFTWRPTSSPQARRLGSDLK